MMDFNDGFGGSNHSAYKRSMSATELGVDLSDAGRLVDSGPSGPSGEFSDPSKGDPYLGGATGAQTSERSGVTADTSTLTRTASPIAPRESQRFAVDLTGGRASDVAVETPSVSIPDNGIAALEDGSAMAVLFQISAIPAAFDSPHLPAQPVTTNVVVVFAAAPGAFPPGDVSVNLARNTLLGAARELGYSGTDAFLALSALAENGLALVGENDPAAALMEYVGGDPGVDVPGDGFAVDVPIPEREQGGSTGPIVAALALGAAYLFTRGG
jgi:hypothetical protein